MTRNYAHLLAKLNLKDNLSNKLQMQCVDRSEDCLKKEASNASPLDYSVLSFMDHISAHSSKLQAYITSNRFKSFDGICRLTFRRLLHKDVEKLTRNPVDKTAFLNPPSLNFSKYNEEKSSQKSMKSHPYATLVDTDTPDFVCSV